MLNIYEYLKTLYSSVKTPLICINEKFDFIYTTKSAVNLFMLDKTSSPKPECIFPVQTINRIKRCFMNNTAQNIKFTDLVKEAEINALITPVTLDSFRFVTIIFYDIKPKNSSSINDVQLSLILREIDNDIIYHTRDIVTLINRNSSIDTNLKNTFIKKAQQIRRSYLPLKMMFLDKSHNEHHVLNLNTLSARIMEFICKRYKAEYFSCELKLDATYPYIDFSFEALQLIICNITVYLINASLGKPHIKVFTNTLAKENQLIMTNDWSDTKKLVELFHKMSYHDPIDNSNLVLMKNLLSKFGARLTIELLENESFAVIIHFKKANNSTEELRYADPLNLENEIMSLMNICLSNSNL